jgi:hypothetical protein
VPRSVHKHQRPAIFRRLSSANKVHTLHGTAPPPQQPESTATDASAPKPAHARTARVVEFAEDMSDEKAKALAESSDSSSNGEVETVERPSPAASTTAAQPSVPEPARTEKHHHDVSATPQEHHHHDADVEAQSIRSHHSAGAPLTYTAALRSGPPRSFVQSLKPYNGRLSKDKWHRVLVRPLILLSYPAVVWSAVVYSCSVGWLIVISESIAVIYREGNYNFNALQTGLVYISPFVGGILGSAVAGRVSDAIVQAMARRNGGLYEPEYRLVMAIPIAITTVLGLMGFGWSAQVGNHWMVPTAFFGIISFGCTMGSTTSITFCVDSYRQYAGEALVTLNFSKNILHGLVFSLFVTGWLADDGPKMVYIWIGIIQLILLLFTIPMYMFGKRLRMWTVRKNFMERW